MATTDDYNHEIRNALTSMAGIIKERLKLINEHDKRMEQLARDYLKESNRLDEAHKCLTSLQKGK